MNTYRYWLFIFLIVFSSCRTHKQISYSDRNRTFTPSQLIEDVDYAFDILKQRHPAPYTYISEEHLNYKIDSIKKLITAPMTSRALYRLVTPVYNSIGCIHSNMRSPVFSFTKKQKDSLEKVSNNRAITQLQLLYQNNKLFVTGSKSPDVKVVPGAQLISIEGNPVANMMDTFLLHSPRDGYNTTFPELYISANFFVLYHLYYGLKDTMMLEFSHKDSVFTQSFSVIHTADTSKQQPKHQEKAKDKKVKNKSKNREPYPYRGKDENGKYILDFRFTDSTRHTAYMKVSSFSTLKSNFRKFYKVSFDSLRKEHTEHLILDMRGNSGGFLFRSIHLYTYLTDTSFIFIQPSLAAGRYNPATYLKGIPGFLQKVAGAIVFPFVVKRKQDGKYYVRMSGQKPAHPNKNNYTRNLYVLTDGFTASAASLLAANIQGNGRGNIVGDESGGARNICFAGKYTRAYTPNTNIPFQVGMYTIAPVVQDNIKGRGVMPQKMIRRNVVDVVQKKDKVVDTLLCEIKNSYLHIK